MKSQRPIGVFDSGLGGLTIVRELRKQLPHESILYFGDLARLPYGIKSKKQIQEFSVQNTRFLLNKKVKAVVVACNSSSSTSYEKLVRKFSLPIFDVIRPAVAKATKVTKNNRIGVIATNATIHSGIYQRSLRKAFSKLKIYSTACPLFVPLVEEGWHSDAITRSCIRRYLQPLKDKGIDTLILGCTHYPILKSEIQKFMGKKVSLIDSAKPTVKALASDLKSKQLMRTKKGGLKLFVSDKPQNFVRLGEKFLGEKIKSVEMVKLS